MSSAMKLPRLSSDGYPRRKDHVVWKVLGNKGVLLSLESGEYFEVNPIGLTIWQRCNGKETLLEIARLVAKRFRAAPGRVASDLKDFLVGLERQKLVEIAQRPTLHR